MTRREVWGINIGSVVKGAKVMRVVCENIIVCGTRDFISLLYVVLSLIHVA